MLLCRKIRLEVTSEDAATLEFMQAKCRARLEPHVPDGTQCADVFTAIEHV